MVEGRLKLDQWEDKTSGQKRSKLKVVLDNVQFLTSRGSSGGAGRRSRSGGRGADWRGRWSGSLGAQGRRGKETDEDVPF